MASPVRLAATVLLACLQRIKSETLPPVILVPGLVGSVLEAKQEDAPKPHWYCKSTQDWHKVWVDVGETLLLPCLNSLLNLSFDTSSKEYVNTPGVTIRPRDFGGIHGIDYLMPLYNEWGHIIKAFEDKGYTPGKDLHGAPYDWRLAGDGHQVRTKHGVGGFYSDLKTLIERTVKSNGAKATVIAHSLGCPTLHYFFHSYVDRDWLETYILQFLPMAGPWAGTGGAFKLLISGEPGASFLPEAIWKPVQSKDASTVWLLPLASVFGNSTLLSNGTDNFTAADHDSVLQVAGLPDQHSMYRNILATNADLGRWQKFVPGLRMHVFFSLGLKTPMGFTYTGAFGANYSKAPVDVQYSDGDGTVNELSLTAFQKWQVDPASQISTHQYNGLSHSDLLSDAGVIKTLVDIATGLATVVV